MKKKWPILFVLIFLFTTAICGGLSACSSTEENTQNVDDTEEVESLRDPDSFSYNYSNWYDYMNANYTSNPIYLTYPNSGKVSISTAKQMASFMYAVNENKIITHWNGSSCRACECDVELNSDIDLTEYYWVPIGTEDRPYEGNFNGNNHTIIYNINSARIPSKFRSNLGFFGYIEESGKVIKDTVFYAQGLNDNSSVDVKEGIVAGVCYGYEISNCAVQGGITLGAECSGYTKIVGGFIGQGIGFTLKNCVSYANLYSISSNSSNFTFGGFVGQIYNSSILNNISFFSDYKYTLIEYCLFLGAFSNKCNIAGGIVGSVRGFLSILSIFIDGVLNVNSSVSYIITGGNNSFSYYYKTENNRNGIIASSSGSSFNISTNNCVAYEYGGYWHYEYDDDDWVDYEETFNTGTSGLETTNIISRRYFYDDNTVQFPYLTYIPSGLRKVFTIYLGYSKDNTSITYALNNKNDLYLETRTAYNSLEVNKQTNTTYYYLFGEKFFKDEVKLVVANTTCFSLDSVGVLFNSKFSYAYDSNYGYLSYNGYMTNEGSVNISPISKQVDVKVKLVNCNNSSTRTYSKKLCFGDSWTFADDGLINNNVYASNYCKFDENNLKNNYSCENLSDNSSFSLDNTNVGGKTQFTGFSYWTGVTQVTITAKRMTCDVEFWFLNEMNGDVFSQGTDIEIDSDGEITKTYTIKYVATTSGSDPFKDLGFYDYTNGLGKFEIENDYNGAVTYDYDFISNHYRLKQYLLWGDYIDYYIYTQTITVTIEASKLSEQTLKNTLYIDLIYAPYETNINIVQTIGANSYNTFKFFDTITITRIPPTGASSTKTFSSFGIKNDFILKSGDKFTVAVTPLKGYTFNGVHSSGATNSEDDKTNKFDVNSANVVSIMDATKPLTIEFKFEEPKFTLNYTNLSCTGNISSGGSASFNKVYTLTALGGDRFKGIYCNDKLVTLGTTYSFVADQYQIDEISDFTLSFKAKYANDGADITPVEITPVGNYYYVRAEGNLAWIAEQVNSGKNNFAGCTIIQTADIDLSGKYWVPIGDALHAFRGTYNGDNHIIKNIKYVARGSEYNQTGYVGLFGNLNGATIKNLTIKDSTFAGYRYVGAFAGYSTNSKFENLTSYDCQIVVGAIDDFYNIYGNEVSSYLKNYFYNADAIYFKENDEKPEKEYYIYRPNKFYMWDENAYNGGGGYVLATSDILHADETYYNSDNTIVNVFDWPTESGQQTYYYVITRVVGADRIQYATSLSDDIKSNINILYNSSREGFGGIVGRSFRGTFVGVGVRGSEKQIVSIAKNENNYVIADSVVGALTGSYECNNSMTYCYADGKLDDIVTINGGNNASVSNYNLGDMSNQKDVYVRCLLKGAYYIFGDDIHKTSFSENDPDWQTVIGDTWIVLNQEPVLSYFYW